MTNKSDDYKQGWCDGYQAGFNVKMPTLHDWPDLTPYPPFKPPTNNQVTTNSCSVCGMMFTNPDGSIKMLGYVCINNKCPSRVRY